jgi:hypothetical protein
MQKSILEISDFTLPCASLLETVLTHAVVHEGLFDFITGGHDEWTVLENRLIEGLPRNLTVRVR